MVDHRDNEPIVALATFGTRFEADVVIAKLKANGINAIVGGVESAYGSPTLGLTAPMRVDVFESDLGAANALLAEDDTPPAVA